jgi:hypothetical protein
MTWVAFNQIFMYNLYNFSHANTSISSSSLANIPFPTTSVASDTVTTSAAEILPYSIGSFGNTFDNTHGWVPWWGTVLQKNGVLPIGGNVSSTGGGGLLPGSSAWTNVTFVANLDWVKGESFGLVARYAGDKNYVICDFGQTSIGNVYMNLRQFVNGKQIDLAAEDFTNYNQMRGNDLIAAIEVQGDQDTME